MLYAGLPAFGRLDSEITVCHIKISGQIPARLAAEVAGRAIPVVGCLGKRSAIRLALKNTGIEMIAKLK